MNELMLSGSKLFSSLYLVEQINIFRSEENNKAILLHKSLLTKIEVEFKEEIEEQNILPSSYLAGNGKNEKCYELNFEQSLQILMSESKIVRRGVVLKLKELSSEVKAVRLPQTYKEALIALVAKEEEKEQLQLQVNNLDTVLDNLLDWVSILKVAKHNGVKETVFNWRVLANASKMLGYEIKKAESPRFGYQNLYHLDAFKRCYPQFNYNLKK